MMLNMSEKFIAFLLLLSTPCGIAVPLSSFYPYGHAANDASLTSNDDNSSSAITLSTPFLFYGTYYSTIYVNNNGDLSFNQSWSKYVPTSFPIPSIPVVAVFQADVDTRGTGSVWYRYTQDASLLAKATRDIQNSTGTMISPQWLFIATWDHVGYYDAHVDKTNTFQVILTTDGVRSYAIFLYADGLIQWPSDGAQVGFNAGDNVTYVNIPGSRTPNILNITSLSNVGIGGQWVFLISQATSCRIAPSITVPLEDISTSLNSKLILKCQALGCPTPDVTWYKDSVALSSGQYLMIPAVSPSDRGFYMCTAVNQYGYASSNEARISVKDLYQYAAHLELNISVTQDIADQLNTHLGENSVLNNSGHIICTNISYSGYTLDVLVTISANYSRSYDTVINELYAILSGALGRLQTNISSVQRFDGCSHMSTCANKYIWPESEIGTNYSPLPCVQRRCGGTYFSGGQWEPVITTCASDYLSCAVNELENLVTNALNNSKAATQLLSRIDNLLDTNRETISQDQGASKLLNILNYYSNNAIINQTTLFTGKTFATQLKDVNVSNGCLTEKSFSVNLGSIDMAVTSNATIENSAIGSSNSKNTTASVRVLPPNSNSCSKTESSVYRLVFHTFLQSTLFPSPEQEKKGMKLGSIIISVGGTAVSLADKLEFSFQVTKGGTNALPVQWITTYNSGSYQVGMWSTEGSTVISRKNNVFVTETYLGAMIRSRKVAIFQGNFGMLLDLNPGGVDCTTADVLSFIGTIVSIACLLLFVITYLFSRPLRKSEHGRVLLNISIALLGLYITYLIAAYASPVTVLCGLSAALVHYFMLVYFMWTASEAIFLYIKLVKVLGNNTNHFALKMGLISWLVPLGIVVVSVGAGYRYYYDVNYCRSSQLPFYLGLILPFLVIYVFDWIVFLVIMVSLYRNSVLSASAKQPNPARDKSYTLRNVLIAAGLSFVLGLGWGFGLAASSHSVSAVACTFQFLFSVFVSSQGLLLLFFHGVRSNDAKNVWRSWIGRLRSKSHVVASSTMGDAKLQKHGQALTVSFSRTTNPNEESTVHLDEKSFDDTEKTAAASDEKDDRVGSNSPPHEKSTITVGEEESANETMKTFASLSLLKKEIPEGVLAICSDINCAQSVAKSQGEDTTL